MGCCRVKGPDSIEARMDFLQRHSFYGMVVEKNDISDNSFEKELKSEMEKLNNGEEQQINKFNAGNSEKEQAEPNSDSI